ncbi:hypothetical protein KUTeg_020158 [Tegillarca granosa]|uniref:BTB domain-containing protein n=1 Tax=Tegillarca granosa TaxID=220873 RepID=A0ABQ9E9S9_TEGGR|nr:hypothetical protein KUTeg_020158 [Tegillarca granosa]
MDRHELLLSCRKGDLEKVQYLVEQKEVEINIRDNWDSTPLYYACLCGHRSIVRNVKLIPLMEKGVYTGALTNDIRNLLKSFNVISTKTIRRDLYEEFLRRLLETGVYADVYFHLNGEEIPAHKSILSARCPYFATLFRNRWLGRQNIKLKHYLIQPSTLKSILQYLYTGRLETHIDDIDDCIRLAKQCKLYELIEEITEKTQERFIFWWLAFFCGRSDYFKAQLSDHFGETDTDDNSIQVVALHSITADIFTRVMYYIYQDYCELTEDTVYDVLCAADLYLLPGLKRQCANCISKYIDDSNVLSILMLSRLYSLQRLEDQCAEFIANNLEKIILLTEFAEIVKKDAKEVKKRQETDSIDIIDEIRFHITSFIQSYSDVEEANEKLKKIDDLLETLDLEG